LDAPCPDDGNPCTEDVCDGSGACTHPALADGATCGADQICRNGACGACGALEATCTDAAQCCPDLECGPIGDLGRDQCCRPLGGSCSTPGQFAECCTVVFEGGGARLVTCAPDNTCGGTGARCTSAATCASGVCCGFGPLSSACCAAGQQCVGGQCTG
jgi:hypothetical protein